MKRKKTSHTYNNPVVGYMHKKTYSWIIWNKMYMKISHHVQDSKHKSTWTVLILPCIKRKTATWYTKWPSSRTDGQTSQNSSKKILGNHRKINKAVASPLQCLIVYMIPCPLTILFLSESTKMLSSIVPSSEVNHVFFSSCVVNPAKDTYKSLFYGVCVWCGPDI